MTNRHLASTDVTLKQQKDAFRRLNGHKMVILTYLCFCFALHFALSVLLLFRNTHFQQKKGKVKSKISVQLLN